MLRISHDNKGTNAGWFLDDVTVDVPSRGDKVVFPCHRWLADDEDDGKIERELYPGQQTHTNPSNYSFFVIYLSWYCYLLITNRFLSSLILIFMILYHP